MAWEGALDWMQDYIGNHMPEEVADMPLRLASNVRDEVIEDLFHEEMDADNYFDTTCQDCAGSGTQDSSEFGKVECSGCKGTGVEHEEEED